MEQAKPQPLERLLGDALDDAIERISQPVELPAFSGTWISAREARELVASVAKVSLVEAEQALCRRALCWVRVECTNFSRREDPHDYVNRIEFFAEQRHRKFTHFTSCPTQTDWSEMLSFFESVRTYEPYLSEDCVVHHASWAMGDFDVTFEKDFSTVRMAVQGLRFDRMGVMTSIGADGAKAEPSNHSQIAPRRASGRPMLNHGEAVANIVLRLAKLLPEERERYTSKAIVADLAAEYRRLGETAPSDSNREKLAAGVLRAFRDWE